MKKTFHIFTVAAILSTISFSAKAQNVPQAYREAISELLTITNMRAISEETATITYDKMGLEFTIPTSQVIHAIFESFWDKALDNYVKIYSKYYTIEEIHQLCEFYKTPLGEKVSKYNPMINNEKLSVMDEYLPEINTVLKKYRKH